jgi:4'-phosphopantetheinyl transferase
MKTKCLIGEKEIHLWGVRLYADERCTSRLYASLSDDEKKSAEGYLLENDKKRFILCRGLLRMILGRYLRQNPKQIRFQQQTKGKPFLRDVCNPPLHFNLAHSGEYVIYALTHECEVGVDIEYLREVNDMEFIARRFFTEEECTDLFSLPHEKRAEGFFNCWTRKEAYIKALGEGLSLPLRQFQVSLIPGQPAAIVKQHRTPPLSAWTLIHLALAEGYVGALAIPSNLLALRRLCFSSCADCFEYVEMHSLIFC